MIYCQFQMLIIDYSLDMFRASLCPSSGEKTTCYCIQGFLLVVLDVAGCGSVVSHIQHYQQKTPYAVTRGLFS